MRACGGSDAWAGWLAARASSADIVKSLTAIAHACSLELQLYDRKPISGPMGMSNGAMRPHILSYLGSTSLCRSTQLLFQ